MRSPASGSGAEVHRARTGRRTRGNARRAGHPAAALQVVSEGKPPRTGGGSSEGRTGSGHTDGSALRRFGASALRRFGASALRRFGASALNSPRARVDTPVIVDTTAPEVRRRRTINAACMASQWLVSGPCRHLFPPMSDRPALHGIIMSQTCHSGYPICPKRHTHGADRPQPAGAGEERDHGLANARAHREEQSARADLEALVETCPVGCGCSTRRPARRSRASGALPGTGARVGGVPARRRARGPARRTLTRRRATARRSWSR